MKNKVNLISGPVGEGRSGRIAALVAFEKFNPSGTLNIEKPLEFLFSQCNGQINIKNHEDKGD